LKGIAIEKKMGKSGKAENLLNTFEGSKLDMQKLLI
jgi:hypothetical protein